jgi:molybdate transport system substrate-binding protein
MIVRRAAALLATAIVLAGCGGSGKPTLTVSAAASLQKAFTTYGGQFRQAAARFSFGGSDALAAQIEQGVKPDVFASANTKLPDLLFSEGLVEKPVVFTANKLVLAVPTRSKIRSLADLERPGVTLVVGTPTVPVGDYTDSVLARLPRAARYAIEGNIRDREPDVTGIVGKLTEGAADAGFLYATDVNATGGALKAIDLPASLQPKVAYGIAIVRGTSHASQAQRFIDGLLSGRGRSDLLADGFLAPPSR